MERWEGVRQTGRCRDQHPSFSSSLLDAIYRSIDESDAGGASRVQPTRGAPDPSLFSARAHHHPDLTTKCADVAAVSQRAVTRPRDHHLNHRHFFTSTSSSSDGSSYGGFSSSEAESAPARSTRPRPIRTGPAPAASDRPRPDPPQEKKKPGSIRSKLRDLRRARPPVSPGARLASFLNSLFAAGGSPKKPKLSSAPPAQDESACSSASSFSRSCLSKTPSSRGGSVESREKRSVRFGPVSVISAKESRTGPASFLSAQPGWGKQRVQEILRAFETEDEDDEEDDVASDASSDLFELENLTAVGVGGGGYRDELPVYETTHFSTNLAIAQGLFR